MVDGGILSQWPAAVLAVLVGALVGYLVARLILRRYVGELRESRDELRRGLERLGETLRSTLDLEGMLGVVVDTAAVTLGAKAAALYLLAPSGKKLRLEVARGFEPPARATLSVGEGYAGRAAEGVPVLLPSGSVSRSDRAPVEPGAATAVAVPLVRGDRTIGVLALYARSTPEPFHQEDVITLSSFAAQASVAIENVLLHQETERLSITDSLTGVANRRFFSVTLAKEIERAQRFRRPLSLLILDIDRFKQVNDEHGHQRGDDVLVALTRRMAGSLRTQIDTLARYGGEEFAVILPETPAAGARVVAEKIRALVRERPFGRRAPLSLSVSVGVASFPKDGGTADELIRSADLALYRAKESGRDRVATAS